MKLSILICTLPERNEFLERLIDKFLSNPIQLKYNSYVEFLKDNNSIMTTGAKRNRLLQKATGDYVCFFDDDDMPSDTYLKHIFEGIAKGADCCSLRGLMTTNGENPELFEHSIRYNEWKTTQNEIKYERYPNHLNCIKANIAKQFLFPDITIGEDHRWSKAVYESGLIKTEHYIDEVIYHYQYRTK